MSDRSPRSGADSGLALADALLKKSRTFHGVTPAAHQRVKRRLRSSLSGRASRRGQRLRSVVVAVAMLFSGTAFGIALNQLMTKPRSQASPSAPAAASDHRAAGRARAKERKGQVAPEPTTVGVTKGEMPPQMESTPASPAPKAAPGAPAASGGVAQPLRLALASPKVDRVPPAPKAQVLPATAAYRQEPAKSSLEPPPTALAWRDHSPGPSLGIAPVVTEEELLAKAVRALRVGHDPSAALAALDEYRVGHRSGRLSVEATVLRAEALTALGRKSEALRDLDAVELGHVPGAIARRLERAQLREAGGQFGNALTDFDWVLAHAQSPSFIEAAMAGRVRCRQQAGDTDGARRDAIEYLRRFPAGPAARQASWIAGAGPRIEGR